MACGGGTSAPTAGSSAPSPPAGPQFTFAPSTPAPNQSIQFQATGSASSWAWSFGDGATSAFQNPTHAYVAAGSYTVTLQAGGTFNRSITVTAPPTGPKAAFTVLPSAPVAGQSVTFRDTSTGGPTTWAWRFGDGATSALANPTHTYAAPGSYTVSLSVSGPAGTYATTQGLWVVPAPNALAFGGSVVLGCPTGSSIKANVFTPTQSGAFYLAYGTTPGTYSHQTTPTPLQPATPVEVTLGALSADTAYVYRLYYQAAGQSTWVPTDEAGFHTARPAGSTFTFCLQGDSHPERLNTQFNGALYTRTLLTAAADRPDFYLTLGDDFSVDTLDPATITPGLVTERYTIQRPYLGLIGRSAPVFLVNGNHEQAARYLLDGTPNNVAVWAQNARNTHYSQPAPDAFYSGNPEQVPFIGLLRNHYAWTWGDALFVVIDPYWGSPTCVDEPFGGGPKRTNLWDATHGDEQYQWLKGVLETSKAKYKFVFAHHVMGTLRGGVELATLYEWGGMNGNGTWGFTLNRPTWSTPIHQLLVANHVTIFFQGHDHIWVHQQLDGVTYQSLSEPADPNYALWNADAYLTGERFPSTGYTRVTVSPGGVKVDYVRTWLPQDETPGQVNGAVAFSYKVP